MRPTSSRETTSNSRENITIFSTQLLRGNRNMRLTSIACPAPDPWYGIMACALRVTRPGQPTSARTEMATDAKYLLRHRLVRPYQRRRYREEPKCGLPSG